MPAAHSTRAVLAAGAIALSACSSGGGGGGGGGGLTITVSRTSLEFVAVNGASASQSIDFTVVSGSGTYYAFVVLDRAGLFSTNVYFTGPASATATLTPTSPPLGTTTGNVTFQLCPDAACSSVAWSKAVPYTVTAFSVTTASLAFTGSEGAAAAPQAIAITPADARHELSATDSSSWLTVARDASNVLQVTASAEALPAGNHTAQILVAPAAGGPGRSIPVTFAVASGIVRPPDSSVTLDLHASLAGAIQVAFRGGLAPSWSATSSRPWLVLTQDRGTGPGEVQYAIDPAQLGTLANWSDDVATVHISSPGLTTVDALLTLQERLPEITMLSPPAVPAGQAATVHVFGRGLSQLGASGVEVSGASGVTTVSSDREAAVAIDGLSEGLATVRVPNPYSIPTRSVTVRAHAGTWSAATAASTGEKRSALFDPLRNAVYAVNLGQSRIDRFRLVDGAWVVDAVSVPSIGDMGISADRRTLYVSYGDPTYGHGGLLEVDPDTLGSGAVHAFAAGTSLISGLVRTRGLQVTNNARLWLNAGGWSRRTYFDTLRGSFATYGDALLDRPFFYASPDGSRMVMAQGNGGAAGLYTSADDLLAAPAALSAFYYGAAFSRDGGVMVVDGVGGKDVWDTATWTLLGRAVVAAGTGTGALRAELSPDGSKAYVMVSSASAIVRVDVFDTSSVVEGTSDLVKLGEIAVTDQAASCGANPPYGCQPSPVLLVGPLGDVLFMVGNQGLVVLPIPPALAGGP